MVVEPAARQTNGVVLASRGLADLLHRSTLIKPKWMPYSQQQSQDTHAMMEKGNACALYVDQRTK